MKRIIALILILVFFTAYLFIAPSKALAVRENGEVYVIHNIIREKLQGKRFWEDQLSIANRLLQYNLDAPRRDAEWDAQQTEWDEEMKELNKAFGYRQSPAEQKADELRKLADEIEQAEANLELDLLLEEWRIKNISRLQNIIPLIEKKIATY